MSETNTVELSDRQKEALATLLIRVGSWTSSRYDQHLRYEVGDDDADKIIAWLVLNLGPQLQPPHFDLSRVLREPEGADR